LSFLGGQGEQGYKTVYQGETEFERVGGTLGGANELAMFLNLVVILSYSVLLSKVNIWWLKLVTLAAVCGGIIGIVFTYSRGGWIACAVPIVALTLLLLQHYMKSIIRALAVLTFGIAFAAAVGLAVPNIRERLFAEDRGSIERRGEMVQMASKMIKDKPMRGVGYCEYLRHKPLYDDSVTGFQAEKVQACHSFLFLIAAENGIPMVIAYLVFFFMVIAHIFKFLKRKIMDAEPFLAFFGIGLVFSLLAQFMQANVIVYRPFLSSLQWLFMGAVLAVSKMIDKRMARLELETKKRAAE